MSKRSSAWISGWAPENEKFWEDEGKFIARRNLIFSILAEHLGFSIWLIWSIVATKLPQAGFHYSTDQLFQLVALPGLIGSLMRFPYTFAVTTFGGRNWTVVSAALLFIPTIALAYFVTQPDTPFSTMLLVSATAGLGGGNFASSMTNISFFYPDRMKGWALGLNAAGGNIGVSTVQLLVPLLMSFGIINLCIATPGPGGVYLQNAGLMWLLPLAIAVFCAYRYMNNLTEARSSLKAQLAIVRRKHTWIMSWIYIGTFGSFIGYSAAFSAPDQDSVPGNHCRRRLPRAAGRISRAPTRRIARRQDRRRKGHVLEFRRDGHGDDRRHLFCRHQGLSRLFGHVPRVVCHDRGRQWLDLSDDPVDFPRGEAAHRGFGGRSQNGRPASRRFRER
jgi:hypothetical protein